MLQCKRYKRCWSILPPILVYFDYILCEDASYIYTQTTFCVKMQATFSTLATSYVKLASYIYALTTFCFKMRVGRGAEKQAQNCQQRLPGKPWVDICHLRGSKIRHDSAAMLVCKYKEDNLCCNTPWALCLMPCFNTSPTQFNPIHKNHDDVFIISDLFKRVLINLKTMTSVPNPCPLMSLYKWFASASMRAVWRRMLLALIWTICLMLCHNTFPTQLNPNHAAITNVTNPHPLTSLLKWSKSATMSAV